MGLDMISKVDLPPSNNSLILPTNSEFTTPSAGSSDINNLAVQLHTSVSLPADIYPIRTNRSNAGKCTPFGAS